MSATDRPVDIHPEIAQAATLPGAFYADPGAFAHGRERIFRRSWQWIGDLDQVRVPGQVQPVVLLEGLLDEPLLLTRDREDVVHCLSNVCTHRAALVCDGPGIESGLRCRYHGRRYALDGRFVSMPEFEGCRDFPSAADHLAKVPFARWRKFLFAGIAPATPLDALVHELDRRCGFLPIEQAVHDPTRSRDYLVRANWALYCDNYLEGFHIPYVHAALAGALDYGAYRTELFPWSNLQLGVASGGDDVFELPPGHPDAGQAIAGYYFWLWPNTMFNVYPWGISINVVMPLAPDRTKVRFVSYVWDPSRLDRGAGAGLDRVEREDEAVVESVQRGVRSHFYARGRYSPTRETGVHHFHRLIASAMAG
jgi:choline monooxygenase